MPGKNWESACCRHSNISLLQTLTSDLEVSLAQCLHTETEEEDDRASTRDTKQAITLDQEIGSDRGIWEGTWDMKIWREIFPSIPR